MKQRTAKRHAPPSPPRGPRRPRGAWRCAFGRLGRITTKTETVHGQTTTHAYRYDLAGRLDQVSVNGQVVEAYRYDPNGNRASLTRGSHTVTYHHDAQDRLLTQGDCTYTYTPAGSLDSKTCGSHTTHYTYTAHGDLTAALLPDGTSLDYIIDGRGRRLGKRIDGNLVQAFVYQDQLNPIAELDGQGNVKATFVYADRAHVPSLMHQAGKTYRLIADHLGSVRLVVDIDTGQIAQRLDYDAWGNVLTDTHPGFQPFGYAGGIYDRDLNLVRFGARDYDPETGRWTAKDPIGFAAGQVSFYGYVDGDPINLIDPAGEVALVGAATNVAIGYGMSLLTGDCYTLGDAAADAAMGAIGAGIFSKAKQLYRMYKLRGLAKANGMVQRASNVEHWANDSGQFLKIKLPSLNAPGAMSQQLRASYRTGPNTYTDPFTGAVGKRTSAAAHIPLTATNAEAAAVGAGVGFGATSGGGGGRL